MKVQAIMLAFHDGEEREIEIPEGERGDLLDLAFHYGQNCFQPRENLCSVSVGDVIRLPDGAMHIVRPMGFAPITEEELAAYKQVPRRDRGFSQYARPLESDERKEYDVFTVFDNIAGRANPDG